MCQEIMRGTRDYGSAAVSLPVGVAMSAVREAVRGGLTWTRGSPLAACGRAWQPL